MVAARMHHIMVVDDDPLILEAMQVILRAEDYEMETFTDPEQALRRAQTAVFDLVISDFRMRGMDGVTLLKAFKAIQPDSVRIIITAHSDLDAVVTAINEAEIYRWVNKPLQAPEVRLVVRQALEHRHLSAENRRLANQVRRQRSELQRLETEHPGITRVRWSEEDGNVEMYTDYGDGH